MRCSSVGLRKYEIDSEHEQWFHATAHTLQKNMLCTLYSTTYNEVYDYVIICTGSKILDPTHAVYKIITQRKPVVRSTVTEVS